MKGQWKHQKYCEKDGDILIKEGTPPNQGYRRDVAEMKDIIDKGGSIEECFEHDFENTMRMYKGLMLYEDLKQRKTYRTEMTEGVWYYGETNVGKSHKAFEDYNPETCYLWTDDNGA
jgi:hypothetical protein